MAKFKERCARCRKNFVIVTNRTRFPICYDCQKAEMQGEIKDPKMKKMFDIPEELYEKNMFLRNIKIAYLKYGELTDRQVEAFQEAVKKLLGEKNEG